MTHAKMNVGGVRFYRLWSHYEKQPKSRLFAVVLSFHHTFLSGVYMCISSRSLKVTVNWLIDGVLDCLYMYTSNSKASHLIIHSSAYSQCLVQVIWYESCMDVGPIYLLSC